MIFGAFSWDFRSSLPCKISIGMDIPKASLFRFENFWPEHPGFVDNVRSGWDQPVHNSISTANVLVGKLKNTRYKLKLWSKNLSHLSSLIKNCNKVIFFLDSLEECRTLFLREWNLRAIIKSQLQTFLRYKNIYWRKIFTNNKIKFGDECTKFFHAMATVSHRKNTITCLKDVNGHLVYDHEGKAALLLQEYRNRMGISLQPNMLFDSSSLVTLRVNLDSLVAPILQQEIDLIVKMIPTDKALGHDGFNGLFLKKVLGYHKNNFYQLCQDFFDGNINLECLIESFITLVPKINNLEIVIDFRPISLFNSSIKLLTKILAERLQAMILQLLHVNQYEFLKSKSIQDCIAWCFEYIHQFQQSKREILILKLDFAKAFDTVEHSAVLQMMSDVGFPNKYLNWMHALLSSGISSILLNGTLGRRFKCKRGVRQGDPLSLLLFVLAAELLQYIVNDALNSNHLTMTIRHATNDFPIVQYADDTIIIVPADRDQILHLKGLLRAFANSTSLRVNFHKSSMVPLNVPNAKLQALASVFGCQIASVPFTYLGLPMGTTKPQMADLTPLMDRVERRLNVYSSFLSYSRRLEMLNFVLSSTVTYAMCSIKLPISVIENIDRIRR
jgi:hypothetical protein